MASEVEICNGALEMLGDQSITSLDDNTTRAKLCKTFYPFVRDFVLRAHPWRCATKRYTCGLLAEVPVFGYTYQFQLPTDCLRVVLLEDDEGDLSWNREGDKILSESTNGNIIYIQSLSDPSKMDPMLVMAVMAKLAAILAHAITDKANLIGGLEDLYAKLLQDARSVNAQEGSTQAFESNVLVDVRS